MTRGNIAIFKASHKWRGCMGYIDQVGKETVLVGIPTPTTGLIYKFCKKEEIEDLGVKYPLTIKQITLDRVKNRGQILFDCYTFEGE